MPLLPGDPAPYFVAPTPSRAAYHFDTVAGRYVVLAFVPASTPTAVRTQATAAIAAHRGQFDDARACCFTVLRHPAAIAKAQDEPLGVRVFLDAAGDIHRAFGMVDGAGVEHGGWVVLDPTLRVLLVAPLPAAAQVMRAVSELPPPEAHAGAALPAPVLITPRVFEPGVCRALIAAYEADGGKSSGFMEDVDGQTVEQSDPGRKRRRDFYLPEGELKEAVRQRLIRRLVPEILKAFQFQPTRIERYLVSCYDAEDRGFFQAHRDNTTKATAHRRFAVTLNLNAEEYEGGDLSFPEFGARRYRAPTGGAAVFSCSLLHEAAPVTKGRRYAFLPFLYDESGAKLREANSAFFAADPGGYRVSEGVAAA